MGYSGNPRHVFGMLFTLTGKWKYDVCLDYTGLDYDDPDLWANAKRALKQATENNISGVTITDPKNFILVVPKPYSKYSHPIMAIPEGFRLKMVQAEEDIRG